MSRWKVLGTMSFAASAMSALFLSWFLIPRPSHPEPTAMAAESSAGLERNLARIDLDPKQQLEVDRILERSSERVSRLQAALRSTNEALRLSEVSRPFRERQVNGLLWQRSELIAYLRGTESRLVSEVMEVLTPDQRRRFRAMRLRHAAADGDGDERASDARL